MSLYEGLEDDKDKAESKPDISGWGSMHKMLAIQKQLQAKNKANQLQPKKQRGTTLAPVVNLRSREKERNIQTGGELYFNLQTGRLEAVGGGGVPVGGTPFIASEAPAPSLLGVTDEYDPLRPNDYEEFVKKRKEQKKREEEEKRKEKEREREERRRRERERGPDSDEEEHKRRSSKRSRDSDEEENEEKESRNSRRSAGAAIAPPTSLIEEDRFSPEREQVQEDEPVMEIPDMETSFRRPGGLAGASFGMAGSVAAKIMEKLGYKEGSGLGKNQQGMSMALQVEKTSKRGGKIIHEKDILKMETEKPKVENSTNANLLKNPSKVILLRNMVGPGEVDDDLEPETAEECTKYGKVIKCVIFEIPDEQDAEESVRIFVEFERMESAIKAVVDLNGRFFGGRMVKACFYNLDKFRRLDLVDDPN